MASSFFPLLLCVSMFVAVSSVVNALDLDYDYNYYDENDIIALTSEVNNPYGCATVKKGLSACQDYLNGHEDSPSESCCENIDDDLWDIAVSVGYQRICDCSKEFRASFIQSRAENEIYKKCEIDDKYHFGIPISEQQCARGYVGEPYNVPPPLYPEPPYEVICPPVIGNISACQEYLNGHEDSPSTACCSNIEDFDDIYYDMGYKRFCDCFKDLRGFFLQNRAEDEIFKKCNVMKFFLPISEQQCSVY